MQMTLSVLSKEIEKLINVEESNFIIYRVEKDVEYECINDFHSTLECLHHFEFLRVRLGHRLLKDEARFPVYLFDADKSGVRQNYCSS